MKFTEQNPLPREDLWPWGGELIIWGYSPDHQYTVKVLQPKRGREGCLSLQYHHEKSESWFVVRGEVWALVIQNDRVITRIMRQGDFQNLPAGTVHRLMGVSEDALVLECSTPDRHAADPAVAKDVIRLHCVLGRECQPHHDPAVQPLVVEAIAATEQAVRELQQGGLPSELNTESLVGTGRFTPP